MSRFVILDLDNCISADAWRRDRINWQHPVHHNRFHEYHSLCAWDQVRNRHLYTNLSEDIIVLTARPNLYRPLTEHWLKLAGVKYRHLIMRNDDESRPSLVVKEMQLGWLHDLYEVQRDQIAIAYDDVPEIVAMYQRNGIRAERKYIVETHSS